MREVGRPQGAAGKAEDGGHRAERAKDQAGRTDMRALRPPVAANYTGATSFVRPAKLQARAYVASAD